MKVKKLDWRSFRLRLQGYKYRVLLSTLSAADTKSVAAISMLTNSFGVGSWDANGRSVDYYDDRRFCWELVSVRGQYYCAVYLRSDEDLMCLSLLL